MQFSLNITCPIHKNFSVSQKFQPQILLKNKSVFKAIAHQCKHQRTCVAFGTMTFFHGQLTDLPLENYSNCHTLFVRMWWIVGISGLQCFTSGTWIITCGPPLETFQSVWRYSLTKRHWQYRKYICGITERRWSETDSVSTGTVPV